MIQPKRTISNGAKIKSPAKNNTGNGNAGNCVAPSDSASKNIAGKRDDIRCWYLRNNSHHVSKLLAPYIYEMGLVEEDFGKNDIQANFTRQNSINKNGLDDECVGYNVGNSNNKICNMTTNNMNLNNVNASCNINQSGNPVNKLVLHSTVQKMFPVTIGTTSNNVRKANDTIMISNGGPCLECYCNDDPVVPRLNPKRFDNEDEYPNHLGCLDSVEDVTKDGGGNNIGNPDWNGGQNIEIRNLNGDYADGRMERPIVTNRCYQCGDFNTQQQQHKQQQQQQMGGYCQNPCCANYNKHHQQRNEKYCTNCSRNFSNNRRGDLEVISRFRNERFFDCHSATSLSATSIPTHKCIHKFTVNERLYPEPVNCDGFGTSRCLICNLPMKTICDLHKKYNNPRSKSKKPDSLQRNNEQTTCKDTKNSKEYHLRYDYGTTKQRHYETEPLPRKVNISCGCEEIELVIPSYVTTKNIKSAYQKLRRNIPKESLALRYQKGVI